MCCGDLSRTLLPQTINLGSRSRRLFACYFYCQVGNKSIIIQHTVILCAVDISKAFDRMNHFGLFCTLMDRLLPVNILQLLEDCMVCQMFHMCEMEFSNIMFLSVDTRNPAGWRAIAILVCGIILTT